MYKNGKMRPVETIPRMVGGGIKENGGGSQYCKHFCKCHNVPSVQQSYGNKNKGKFRWGGRELSL
jgi:hypothetical protein